MSTTLEATGAHVTGVDRDAGMLTVAAERVAGPLLRADAHDLPFPDNRRVPARRDPPPSTRLARATSPLTRSPAMMSRAQHASSQDRHEQ
jgi:predicted alpha/beta-hydrolase family hydrolase